jgi:RNA polymerase sigma-70 factor (ECF subfamily)
MAGDAAGVLREAIDAVYRAEARRAFATLVRLLGDFDLAEEALHEAFVAAVEQWPEAGVPANPRAWLVATGRFKAVDALRRRARLEAGRERLAAQALRRQEAMGAAPGPDDDGVADDQLRLIFTCCHPALPVASQVALTLREVGGLTTEEIAAAFLGAPAAIAQRIVRGKAKIREARIPYVVPTRADLPDRLDAVLSTLYLIFNEGYAATSGASLTRPDLSREAIRLGRLLVALLPDPEAIGLLALMLLQESRRAARATATGDLVLLEDQDRASWDRELIAEGRALVVRAFDSGEVGAYAIQAAIAAAHAEAPDAAATDWGRIVGLYDLLARASPSPVVELNRAVALAMRDGRRAGLERIEPLLGAGPLEGYHLAHAARADLCRRLGHLEAARESYRRALDLARQEPERRFLARRLAELG